MLKSKSKLFFSTGIAFSFPAVLAEEKKENSHEGRIIKPSKLPIYEGREEIYNIEYFGKEKTQFQEGITVARKEVESAFETTREVREAITNFVETGKAHSLSSLDYIQDKDNFSTRIGVISAALLSGILLGTRKGFIRKLIYSSIATGGAASVCYPEETVKYSSDFVVNANEYAAIGYNFVTGVKPKDLFTDIKIIKDLKPKPKEDSKKSQSSPPPEVSTEKTASKPAEDKPSTETEMTEDVSVEIINVIAAHPVSKIVGDIGQSNPADKDMYTTRG